jgi:hypothetical protein
MKAEDDTAICPYSGLANKDCSLEDGPGRTEKHIKYHLDRMIELGDLMIVSDGDADNPTLLMQKAEDDEAVVVEEAITFQTEEGTSTYTMQEMSDFFTVYQDYPEEVPEEVRALFMDERINPKLELPPL